MQEKKLPKRGPILVNFVAWMIVASEIAFWVVIVLGLFTRYVLKQKKAGLLLLALTPVVDVVLLVVTSVDLYRGATATIPHALAAVYIGVSLAFGKSMIQWADEKFQQYVTKEGTPKPKLYGMEYAKHYAKSWFRHLFAYVIGAALLAGTIYFINDAERTASLWYILRLWTVVLGVDLLFTASYFLFPKKDKRGTVSKKDW